MSAPRPSQEEWDLIFEAFAQEGDRIMKVVKATGCEPAVVRQAWVKGWPGKPGTKSRLDPNTGNMIPGTPTVPALLPIKDIMERVTLQARAARERIYRSTMQAHERLMSDAQEDALRQRALEATAVRTSMMLADHAVRNALDIQIAARPLHEALAVRMQERAADPDATVGSILKALREAAEIGRLATQQLEAAQQLEQKHLGAVKVAFDGEEKKSPEQLVGELKRMLLESLTTKGEQVVLEAEVVTDALEHKG